MVTWGHGDKVLGWFLFRPIFITDDPFLRMFDHTDSYTYDVVICLE